MVPARFQEGGITYYSILDKVAAAEAALKRISERPNKYPGNCSCCGTYVEDYKGYLQRRTGANGYYVWCEKCLAEMLKQAKNRKTRKTLHETVAHKDGRIKIDDIRFRKFDIIDRSLIRTDTRWSPNSTGICSACKRDMHVNADGICLSCFKMPEPSNAKAAELAAMEAKFRWGGFIDVAEYKAYYSLVSTSKMQFIG